MKKNEIITVENFYKTSFKEKASEFIGKVFHVEREEEAEEKIRQVRKKFYDARHHCYAFNLYSGKFRYSDDGEPTGTAGIRIYNAIKHFELVNVLVISIRYFGGVKLGVGPLGKAYYRSAYETLEAADKIKKVKHIKISVKYNFNHTQHVHHFLNSYNVKIIDNKFEEIPIIIGLIETSNIENLVKDLSVASNNEIGVRIDDETILL